MKSKTIILIIVVIAIIGSIYYLESNKIKIEPTKEEIVKEGKYIKAPELIGISGYLNSEEEFKIEDFRGKVVLIDFWTYTCINCIRTFPFLNDWDEKYRDKGLIIIGVHTPEFEFEKDYENVKNAIEEHRIKYRVVQDNDYATWTAYKNRFWPRKYLIDKDGFIRYDHIGEGAYEQTEKKIQELLTEIGEDISGMGTSEIEEKTPIVRLTPELYAGYEFALPRGQNIGNSGGLQINKVYDYSLPNIISKDKIYLKGKWISNPENLESKGGSIILDFTADKVNIVSKPFDGISELEVLINDNYVSEEQAGSDVVFKDGKATIMIDESRLYNIINGNYGSYKLELRT